MSYIQDEPFQYTETRKGFSQKALHSQALAQAEQEMREASARYRRLLNKLDKENGTEFTLDEMDMFKEHWNYQTKDDTFTLKLNSKIILSRNNDDNYTITTVRNQYVHLDELAVYEFVYTYEEGREALHNLNESAHFEALEDYMSKYKPITPEIDSEEDLYEKTDLIWNDTFK